MKCSYCQQEIIRNLTFKEILFPLLIKSERCSLCQKKFKKITDPVCPTCFKPGWTVRCDECQQWKKQYPYYDFCHQALFNYNEAFKEWIYQYKFLGDFRLKTTFTVEIQEYFSHKKDWIICCIPLSEQRFLQRGFNQVEAFLQTANIKTSPLLERSIDTLPQSNKNRQERLASPQVFAATDQTIKIRNKKVLIVDDVYTTGRTLFHAAEILQKYQPEKIQTFSLAR
ncbi:ComF family protein [Tetragenococcus muriaticus]|uniref:Phosphoribosyltransferase family protein n=2 Tax=Tetragenococcus muriaticus TaxID=64642 RepID=A0A091CCH8_9ENTE|nr:phosphoribosyltransferase family protein [Tetragenococcus muriaticus]KFN90358.1 phosphoribosyltransferase family protein [Tetragenococcus muriaticus 3MR10-3]KFN90743.1 phosphoribosyltransferase family protein [Tetragenococcus muriaticus PMC-11-5]GMA46792.1 amidophosphoribosyltransferase [Tetragenococcus muriaticus]